MRGLAVTAVVVSPMAQGRWLGATTCRKVAAVTSGAYGHQLAPSQVELTGRGPQGGDQAVPA